MPPGQGPEFKDCMSQPFRQGWHLCKSLLARPCLHKIELLFVYAGITLYELIFFIHKTFIGLDKEPYFKYKQKYIEASIFATHILA